MSINNIFMFITYRPCTFLIFIYFVGLTSVNAYPAKEELSAKIVAINISCFGKADGILKVIPKGGKQPYRFIWSNGTKKESISDLYAGNYIVTVIDKKGDSVKVSAKISEPSLLTVSMQTHPVSCVYSDDGAVSAKVLGGNSPYTYIWFIGTGDLPLDSTSAKHIIRADYQLDSIPAYGFTVTVTDTNGCTTQSSARIGSPDTMLVTLAVQHITCNRAKNGTISSTVEGAVNDYQFKWSTGATTPNISNLDTGGYYVYITDKKGCNITLYEHIEEPLALTDSIITEHVSCPEISDGVAMINVLGGNPPYQYLWSNGATSNWLKALSDQSYSVTITDSTGCVKIDSADINTLDLMSASMIVNDATCYENSDGTIDLFILGGSTPIVNRWANGDTSWTITNLKTGTYAYTVTDNVGCTYNDSIAICHPDKLKLTTKIYHIPCSGGQTGYATLSVSGGTKDYEYFWSNGTNFQQLQGVKKGNYSVTVTDGQGCIADTTVSIFQDTFKVKIIGKDICFNKPNGAAHVETSGGNPAFIYIWNTESLEAQLKGLSVGTYSVDVLDATGCSAQGSVTLKNLSKHLEANISTTQVSIDDREGLKIEANVKGDAPPFKYNWSNGQTKKSISVFEDGAFTLTVTDNNGCTIAESVSLGQ